MIDLFMRADRLRLAELFTARPKDGISLQGVCVEPYGEGLRLFGTDGHVGGIFLDEAGFTPRRLSLLVPKALAVALKGLRKHETFCWFGIIGPIAGPGRYEARLFNAESQPVGELEEIRAAMLHATHDGVVWSGAVQILDHEYPEWFRVIPPTRACTALGSSINPQKLFPFQAVADSSGTPILRAWPAGAGQAVLISVARGDFLGLIMPVAFPDASFNAGRVEADIFHAPNWATEGAAA